MKKFIKCPPEKPYYMMQVEEGEVYSWCACGRSKAPPFCDGSHSGTNFSPVVYTASESRNVFFCGCKKTANAPMCDGAHKKI